MESSIRFLYEVKDINKSIRQTQSLLRVINNLRQMINDVQDLMKKPSLAKFFWVAIQLIRTYNSLRRLLRLLQMETRTAALLGGLGEIKQEYIGDGIVPTPPVGIFEPISMSVQAYRDNIPMELERIDMSNFPEASREALQRVFEVDAEMTVMDARAILNERVNNYVSPDPSYQYSGNRNLENSINWRSTTNGVTVYADAYYAWWVEQGHHSFGGHWFMGDAAEMAKQRLPLKIQEELYRLIGKV